MEVVKVFLEPILKDALAKRNAYQGLQSIDKDADGETLLDHSIRQTTGAYHHKFCAYFTTE